MRTLASRRNASWISVRGCLTTPPPAPSPKLRGGERQGLLPLSLQGRGRGEGFSRRPLSRSRRRRRRPKACSQEIVRSTNQRNPPSPLLRIPTRGSRVARHAICQGINTLRPRRHRTCSCALHLENILDFASEGPLNRPEIDNP